MPSPDSSVLGARLAGQLAFMRGDKVCPYDRSNNLWAEWWRGYNEIAMAAKR